MRRTREEAEQARQELLTTALRCYAERGINQVSLKAIAAEAGVTHGAFYWHFKNRDDLLIALAQSMDLPFEQHLIDQLQAIDQDALAALTHFLIDVTNDILFDPHAQQVYNLLYSRQQMLPQNDELMALLSENREEWMGYINRFLKQARKQKQLRKKTRSLPLAEMLFGEMQGVLAVCDSLHPDVPESEKRLITQLTFENTIRGLMAELRSSR